MTTKYKQKFMIGFNHLQQSDNVYVHEDLWSCTVYAVCRPS